MKRLKVEEIRGKGAEIMKKMISLYCRKQHGREQRICLECDELLQYATKKIHQCPFAEERTFCSVCKVHCYQEEQRQKIRRIMKFSGPRMICRYPVLTLRHGVETMKRLLLNTASVANG